MIRKCCLTLVSMRAGKLLTGDEIVHKAIRSGEAKMVIVAGDASANTQRNFATNVVLTRFRFLSDWIEIVSVQASVKTRRWFLQ